MGEVFLAERADGRFAQQVAIKFLRPEWSQTELEARFLREGQILARLEHPSIARLLDSGIAATGIPYLVLEYVEGQPITEYCRIRQLKLVDRLLLILEVCEAVSYAHHHLVVHRDLKPSNIFVNQEGGVRLLDFGIGKLLDEVAGAESTRTILGALTPQYASPEQISGRPMSTATDVYGLGLVLFELLTEQRPYEIESSSAAELAHLVLETPAPLASLVSGRGGGNTVPWSRALRGDLDAIADKALRKEPAERYLSAEALAEDLRRFLAGLPVAARRGARGYRLGKYLWRHRLGLAAAATIFIAVAAGIAGVLWQARLAEGERRKAVASERKALAVNRFLIDELLGAASPEAARGRDLTVRQVLDVAARRVGSAFSEQPDLEEALHAALGEAFLDLGDLGAAAEHLERSVALTRSANARGADVALSNRILLSRLRLAQGRAVEAEALLEEVLAESSQPSIGRRAIEMGLARAWRGKARERQGRLDEAERDLRSAVDALASAGALATHDHLTALEMLAQTLVAGRKDTEGEATERVAVEARPPRARRRSPPAGRGARQLVQSAARPRAAARGRGRSAGGAGAGRTGARQGPPTDPPGVAGTGGTAPGARAARRRATAGETGARGAVAHSRGAPPRRRPRHGVPGDPGIRAGSEFRSRSLVRPRARGLSRQPGRTASDDDSCAAQPDRVLAPARRRGAGAPFRGGAGRHRPRGQHPAES